MGFLLDAGRATREARRWAVIYLALSCLAALMLVVDTRVLPDGQPVMLKPLKFALSFSVHCATIWLLGIWTSRAASADRWFAAGVWITLIALVAELGAIAVQGLRGVPSHFNYATPFDRAMFTIMGIGTIGLVASALLFLIGILARRGQATRLMQLAMGAGVVLMLIGCAIGVLMVMPTPEQAAALANGISTTVIGSHGLGSPSTAAIPVLGWSLVVGDWRVAHFLGVHGLQALPLLAFMVSAAKLAERAAIFALTSLSGLYFAFTYMIINRTTANKSPFLFDFEWLGSIIVLIIAAISIVAITYLINDQYRSQAYD